MTTTTTTEATSPITRVLIVHGGELAHDVAQQWATAARAGNNNLTITVQCASERPTKWMKSDDNNKNNSASTLVCFVVQTVENAAPTEQGGTTTRYFQRQTHPTDLVQFRYAVLGLGDSNLLLDRQTTTAKDCNQVAQALDARLAALGGTRHHALGLADERTGLTEVEPWMTSFWASINP